MKKLLVACALLMGMTTAQAQEFHLGASVGVGVTGITVDAAATITDYVGIRAGADIFPSLVKYGTTLDIDGLEQRQKEYDRVRVDVPALGLPAVKFPNAVDIEGKQNSWTTGHLLVDVYPIPKVAFHVTVGAYFGATKLISVYTTKDDQLQGVNTYNKYVDEHPGKGYEKIGLSLGEKFLTPDPNGHVDAYVKVNGVRPYVGLGWGRAVPKTRLGFSVDLGCQFWGNPKVYCQDEEVTASEMDGKDGGLVKVLTKFVVYPALTFRLTGRII